MLNKSTYLLLFLQELLSHSVCLWYQIIYIFFKSDITLNSREKIIKSKVFYAFTDKQKVSQIPRY